MSKVFGELIKQRRMKAGLTLQEVAMKAGTSKSHVWGIENGKVDPGLGVAVDLAAALGLRIKFLPFDKR